MVVQGRKANVVAEHAFSQQTLNTAVELSADNAPSSGTAVAGTAAVGA